MEMIFKLKTEWGEFESEIFEVSEDNFQGLCDEALKFHMGTWSMMTKDGYLVVPPEICRKSILLIQKINQHGLHTTVQEI